MKNIVKKNIKVPAYQRSKGLTANGIVGFNTWLSLQEDVVGRGITSTIID